MLCGQCEVMRLSGFFEAAEAHFLYTGGREWRHGLCQNGKFWRSPLGVLELIKCKALRVRATGVYFSKVNDLKLF